MRARDPRRSRVPQPFSAERERARKRGGGLRGLRGLRESRENCEEFRECYEVCGWCVSSTNSSLFALLELVPASESVDGEHSTSW